MNPHHQHRPGPPHAVGSEIEEPGPDLRLARLLADVVAGLISEQDAFELLDRVARGLAELVPAAQCGLLLVGAQGRLELVASSDESARLLELFQLQREEGPCVEAVRTGEPVVVEDVGEPQPKWPSFAAAVHELGYRSLLALPMTVEGEVLGGANVFSCSSDAAREETLALAHVVVDTAARTLVMQRRLDQATSVSHQLEHALRSRVVIEQAKGILAEHAGIDLGEAFTCLRNCARQRRMKLQVLAAQVAARSVRAADVLGSEYPADDLGLRRGGR